MNVLVINAGSSSIKCEVINTDSSERLLTMTIERVLQNPEITFSDTIKITLDKEGHQAALEAGFPQLIQKLKDNTIDAIGHRVVHGGSAFQRPTLIDDDVVMAIEQLNHLAPLHNPINVLGIRLAQTFFEDIPQVAIFDTAFHSTLPSRAKYYAIPSSLTEKYNLQRYGFHGTSHEYVANEAAKFLTSDIRDLRIITCHLGNGCSISAVEYGRSIETSMGMTPLEGLVMGTRSGDLDPGLILYLLSQKDMTLAQLDNILNKEAGLKGLSGESNDMRDILEKAAQGNEKCRLAIQVFSHRVRKYIGAYTAIMGGVDAIVFTGGIGENSPTIRHRIVQRLDFMGAIINEDKNHDIRLSEAKPIAEFSMKHSRVKLLATRTDEQLSIARQTAKLLDKKKVNKIPTIPVAISARHIHLRQETVEALFGEGYQLTVKKQLSQPGQFAANETVTLVGPKNQIENVRILGPVRSKDQVEISRTDEFFLGIDAPIRESGKVENSPGCVLIGPSGKITLHDGVICAWRHIHMTPEDAKVFGVKDRSIVDVKIQSEDRTLTFGNVLIRVSPNYKLEMHIDTDEGNAAEITRGATGVLVSAGGEAHLA